MSKSRIIQLASILFFGSLLVFLIFFTDTSLVEFGIQLAQAIVIGIIFGVTLASFYSISNPPEWIFNYRHVIEGIGWGLMIASISIVTNSDHQLWSMGALFSATTCIIVGILFIRYTKHRRLQNRMEAVDIEHPDTNCYGNATLVKERSSQENGLLLIDNNYIRFFADEERNLKLKLSEIKPQLITKTWFNLPSGIRLTDNISIKNTPFPGYWLKKINDQKQEFSSS